MIEKKKKILSCTVITQRVGVLTAGRLTVQGTEQIQTRRFFVDCI